MMLGEKIRLLRTDRSVSIRKLSELTGLSKSTLSDIENNKSKKPTVDTIERVAKALKIPITDLFDEGQDEEWLVPEQQRKQREDDGSSEIFLRSVARAKGRPKETQEKIAEFIELILAQEDQE